MNYHGIVLCQCRDSIIMCRRLDRSSAVSETLDHEPCDQFPIVCVYLQIVTELSMTIGTTKVAAWLSATLSWAKVLTGPSRPGQWLGPAQTGSARLLQAETYIVLLNSSIGYSRKNSRRAFEWRCTYPGLFPAVFRRPTDFHRMISWKASAIKKLGFSYVGIFLKVTYRYLATNFCYITAFWTVLNFWILIGCSRVSRRKRTQWTFPCTMWVNNQSFKRGVVYRKRA